MTSIKHKSTPLIGYEIERGHIERNQYAYSGLGLGVGRK